MLRTCRTYGARAHWEFFPALTRWANFCRAYRTWERERLDGVRCRAEGLAIRQKRAQQAAPLQGDVWKVVPRAKVKRAGPSAALRMNPFGIHGRTLGSSG